MAGLSFTRKKMNCLEVTIAPRADTLTMRKPVLSNLYFYDSTYNQVRPPYHAKRLSLYHTNTNRVHDD